MSFETWCTSKNIRPRKPSEIVTAIASYLRDDPEIVAICRESAPNVSADARAQGIFDDFVRRSPIPTPAGAAAPAGAHAPAGPPPPAHGPAAAGGANPAIAAWKAQFMTAINTAVTALKTQGGLQVARDVADATRLNALADHTAEIPSPYEFYDKLPESPMVWAKAHVTGYLDFLIAAINSYIENAASHSNRRKRIQKATIDTLRAARANPTYLPDNQLLEYGIFNKKIASAREGVADNLVAIAQFWSTQRTGTATRVTALQAACAAIGKAEGKAFDLRRYGCAAEAEDIRSQRGLFQKEGASFEQYKWFVDLGVPDGTTSVSDTDRAFWVKLYDGAAPIIRDLQTTYNSGEPAVIHKPDMGGERGCLGIHEDCLVVFNALMVASIEIRNQKLDLKKADGAIVKPD